MGPHRSDDTVTPHTRPPADDDADHMLVRTVECLEGSAEIELICEPVFDYGRTPPTGHCTGMTATRPTRRAPVRPSGYAPICRSASRAPACARVKPSRPANSYTALCHGPRILLCQTTLMTRTGGSKLPSGSGVDGLGRARIPDHRWRYPIQRSALAIKGLTYMPTGATVAALTTSLPETPGGERNWDYRYSWLRDSTFTLQALHWLNLDWEADEFMQFVAELEPNKDGSLQIMYGIDGRRDLTESTRDDLTGYAGARPVRIGNGAFDQRQNDVYGAALDSIFLHTRRSNRLPRALWPIVQAQAECAINVWREPDQGIWEARGAPQHYVSSKLMCWVAMDRAAKLAEIRGDPELAESWRATADEIREDILAHGVKKASCGSTTRPKLSMLRTC